MVFADLFFLFAFIPAFVVCYLLATLLEKKGNHFYVRNAVLVLFSLFFYAWGEPKYVFLMLGSVVINFFVGKWIDGATSSRKWALFVGVSCNLLALLICKYLGFIAQTLTSLGCAVPDPGIALPIGISFYTFQSISYLVDVYRKQSPAQKRFCDLLLYISMFPQLIAGPIVRYDTIAREINCRSVSWSDVSEGMYRFIIGLGKKVVLANQLSIVSGQLLDVEKMSEGNTWNIVFGGIAFALQIYFDFSGYSDMAIGMGRGVGFHFKENFDHPFCSQTITEFWRRWHISLGSFFRDYVYIPLGGNRKHQIFNIIVVWFLTGMWHGACWNYILWGLYFGLFVILEKYTILKIQHRIPKPFLYLYCLVALFPCWVLFYFEDFSELQLACRYLFAGGKMPFDTMSLLCDKCWLIVSALVLCLPIGQWLRKIPAPEWVGTICKVVFSICILVMSVALLVGATNNVFLYTRF